MSTTCQICRSSAQLKTQARLNRDLVAFEAGIATRSHLALAFGRWKGSKLPILFLFVEKCG